MKRYYLLLISAILCLCANAQTQIWQKGVATLYPMGEMTYSNQGQQLHIDGVTYKTAEVDSITFNRERRIIVTYAGTEAKVVLPDMYKDEVTADVIGADVVITNNYLGEEDEYEIVLSGESQNGSFTYHADYKCTITLAGLSLTSKTGAALDIKCGKRVNLQLTEGTTNSLADGATGDQKGCLHCKGHLEIAGSGTLNITGNARHGINTKEYLQLKKSTGTINIVSAASDAIHAGQYFQMNGGTITFDANTIGDGIQVESILLDDEITFDETEEQNGQVIIKGGSINGSITHQDCKAIKCDRDITISGGDITILASGNGSRGIQTDSNMLIEDGTINITAAGARCTLPECAEDPHRCMGIKIDGNLTVTGGNTTVTNTGSKSRGIKVGGTYSKTGGILNATISQ